MSTAVIVLTLRSRVGTFQLIREGVIIRGRDYVD